MMRVLSNRFLWVTCLAALALAAVAAMVFQPPPGEVNGGEPPGREAYPEEGVAEVRTVQPMRNLPTYVVVQEPADVEAFYRADLDSQVAGVVKTVTRGIGDQVRKGDLLVEVDVPDRVQEVAEKEQVVEQRRRELEMSRAQARRAAEGVKAAREKIRQRLAEVTVAVAEEDLRKDIWTRYTGLGQDRVVTPDLVVEKKKGYLVAQAGTVSSRVAVQRAYAEWGEAKAKLDEAQADIRLKETLIQVARKDRDLAQARLDYAKITAPFDGVVIRRNVDPGDFVQNAATAHTQPLLSLVRNDIMTVVMKLPDTYAPYVTLNTDAVIHLPGRLIKARVTRYSPSIHEKDRTMRIEVDLYNEGRREYHRFLLQGLGAFLPPLGAPHPLQAALALTAGRKAWRENMKGNMDPFPAFPENLGGNKEEGNTQRLLPRMYGTMKLLLRDFQNAHLIPSRAVFNQGGKSYIMVVESGRAHQIPVKVQVDDTRLAKVTMLVRKELEAGDLEVAEELSGTEQIILKDQSGQMEVQDGQKVQAEPVKNWPAALNLTRVKP